MRLSLTYAPPTKNTSTTTDVECVLYKHKSYESDTLDEDMIVSPVSHIVDRAILDDFQITSKSQVDKIIQFLENLKPSLKY